MTKGKISPQRKGELRWERLEDAERSGVLQRAKTCYEIAEIANITDRSRGYGWVSNLISKGYLSKTMRGVENGKFVYEYHLVKRPSFRCGKGSNKCIVEQTEKPVEKPVATPIEETLEETLKEHSKAVDELISIEVKGLTIKAKVEDVVKIIKSL